ncbi:D-alanyl-D-alanine carboxypeptidase [[Clostridium] sordellii]|uniref:M15 family metallopeptidase n=1 Tax=Paraclostridium sordellii TaxID=1505 RepID=UPI0005DDB6A1|nr:M15 family metallopeptidase [Paeniclostridium sordellii]CEQ09674.1 D-alanyl-D-alanine carboxypeptidase [[Clostridium] sordellii] [Paeniclostridium sordellii]
MLKKGAIKIAIVVVIGFIVFQIFSFTKSKEKETYADTDKIKVEEISKEPVHKKSEYIQGEKPLYVDGVLVVNKDYGLPSDYAPESGSEDTQAMKAFNEMKEAAKKDGIRINVRSGYRSYDTQVDLYNNYVKADGKKAADRYSAIPGFSEHQTGLALDITTGNTQRPIGTWFDDTPQAKWLYENAYKYGFILRYPKGKEDTTGYMYESWHYRYIGKEHSKNFKMNDLTLEEYLGLK